MAIGNNTYIVTSATDAFLVRNSIIVKYSWDNPKYHLKWSKCQILFDTSSDDSSHVFVTTCVQMQYKCSTNIKFVDQNYSHGFLKSFQNYVFIPSSTNLIPKKIDRWIGDVFQFHQTSLSLLNVYIIYQTFWWFWRVKIFLCF